jgi:signal transduction histidine kinase
MIGLAVPLAGWVAALGALVALGLARRMLALHLEAVARACHELRGPLTAISLGVELEGRRGTVSAPRIRAIELELGRAALAIEDLERARRHPPLPNAADAVNVRELLSDSVEACRPTAAARGVGLRLRWSGPDGIVCGDRLRLAQATGNLIANAIEHGGGKVEVRGRCDPDGVRIELLDDGPGLSARVTELIGRRSPARQRGHGLRIAQAVASSHGGRLAAAPSERGARLVLELPATARLPGTSMPSSASIAGDRAS